MHAAAAVLLLSSLSGPVPEPELLPAPKPTRVEQQLEAPLHVYVAPPLPPGIGFFRPDPSQVWQFYGVNHRGQMVPRVLDTPYGAFAPPDGRPFPWAGLRETSYRPFFTR